MIDSIENIITESEIIIIGKNEKNYKGPILKASESVHIIDLVKMFNKTEAPKDNYEGIGW